MMLVRKTDKMQFCQFNKQLGEPCRREYPAVRVNIRAIQQGIPGRIKSGLCSPKRLQIGGIQGALPFGGAIHFTDFRPAT